MWLLNQRGHIGLAMVLGNKVLLTHQTLHTLELSENGQGWLIGQSNTPKPCFLRFEFVTLQAQCNIYLLCNFTPQVKGSCTLW